ncbi:MAG: glycosyltransferase family 4 protein [Deltaproteobacteria bacterium]|nr:glycosyltransferase family 4 protein [Deltaproteobacteria bacterium]
MLIILYFLALILGIIGAWSINKLAFKWGLIDSPNDRSSHERPTPKGGGIGILAAFTFASLFLKLSFTFWVPIACIALVSFFGDRLDLSPTLRLPLQFIAAILVLLLISDLWPLTSLYSFLLTVFFVVFIVATANWYNFMDGINGIAGITGIVGFGLLAAFNILNVGDSQFTILSICIAFACLGFLPFNIPKAKVFMGDVGSILLGFVFAAIVVLISKSFLDYVCLIGFLFPFYADEFVTMAIRLKDSENLLKPHRRHFYQILANEMGIAHWKVSMGYGILQLIVGLSVLWLRNLGIYAVLSILIIFFIGFIWVNYAFRIRIEKRG